MGRPLGSLTLACESQELGSLIYLITLQYRRVEVALESQVVGLLRHLLAVF